MKKEELAASSMPSLTLEAEGSFLSCFSDPSSSPKTLNLHRLQLPKQERWGMEKVVGEPPTVVVTKGYQL